MIKNLCFPLILLAMNFPAIILAAGKGTRMLPFTLNCPKPLLPILNKPIIVHSIERLMNAGYNPIYVVISEEDNVIPNHLKRIFPTFDIRFIVQTEALGTAHAVLQTESHLSANHFLVVAGDSLFTESTLENMRTSHLAEANEITLALEEMPFELMKHSSTVDFREGRVWEMREKPESEAEVLSKYNSAALYVFSSVIFSYLHVIKQSKRAEFELASAINLTIDSGSRVGGVISERVSHISNPFDLWKFNLQFLYETGEKNHIHETTTIPPSCKVRNSIIGENCTLTQGIILESCVIMPNSQVNRNHKNMLIQNSYFLDFSSH